MTGDYRFGRAGFEALAAGSRLSAAALVWGKLIFEAGTA
jgi:hypothetical protein